MQLSHIYNSAAHVITTSTQNWGRIKIHQGNGEYLLTHRINRHNQAPDGLKTISFTAVDLASNEAVVEVVALELDNTAPVITNISSNDEDTIYRNGDSIEIVVTSDASDYVVSAGFGGVDQRYQPDTEEVTNYGDNTYTIQYQVRDDNPHVGGKRLPIAISVSDGVSSTVNRAFTIELDNAPPTFVRTTSAEPLYSNGKTVSLSVTLDGPGQKLTADFSALDSSYVAGDETVLDNRNNTYTVKYLISNANTKQDVQDALIRLEARDLAGNVGNHSITVALDNIPPEIHDARVADKDNIYRTGEIVAILVEADSRGYTVGADFSFVDSEYNLNGETVEDRGDSTYLVTYLIDEDNTKAVGEAKSNLPVRITVADAVHTTYYDDFSIDVDNEPPVIEIIEPNFQGSNGPVRTEEILSKISTTEAQLRVSGKTEAQGRITAAPIPITSDFNPDTGDFSFTFTLDAGDNLVEIQATDVAGNKTLKTLTIRYNPIISMVISPAIGGTVILPEEIDDAITNNDTRVIIPPEALRQSAEVTITRVTEGFPAADHPDISSGTTDPRVAYRVSLNDQDGVTIPGLLNRAATLSLQFPSIEIEDDATSRTRFDDTSTRAERLNIFKWDGIRWNNFGGLAKANNTVSIETTSVSGVFAVFPVSAAPSAFTLKPPRPNPFTPNNDGVNDVITLFYDNPSGESPIIRIYDIRGVLVRELQNVGVNSAEWDGTDDVGRPMPLGLYIYQVDVGDQTDGGTITLAR